MDTLEGEEEGRFFEREGGEGLLEREEEEGEERFGIVISFFRVGI